MVGINEILIFLVGGIIGFVICRLTLGRKQKAAQQKELDNSKADLQQYKAQVNSHFNDSAKLMGEVASSYQALYKHMAGQSKTLLSETETLPFPQLKTPSENPAAQETDPEKPLDDVTAETAETVSKNQTTQEANQQTAEKETVEETVEKSSETVSQNNTLEKANQAAAKKEAEKEVEKESSESVSKNQTTQETNQKTAAEEPVEETEKESSETVSQNNSQEANQAAAKKEAEKEVEKEVEKESSERVPKK